MFVHSTKDEETKSIMDNSGKSKYDLDEQKKTFLLIGNVLGALAHLAGIITIAVVSKGDSSLAYPSYHPVVVLDADKRELYQNDTLKYSPAMLKPMYVETSGYKVDIPVTWLAYSFFDLSLSFHCIIILLILYPYRWIPMFLKVLIKYLLVVPIRRLVLGDAEMNCENYSLYYYMIETCRNPLRWVEYFFSASIMVVLISYVSGVRSFMHIFCIVGLISTTMLFGLLSESVIRFGVDLKTEWEQTRSLRLFITGLGWIPYSVAWASILRTYFTNVDYYGENDDLGWKFESWITLLVMFQLSVFSCFGFVQIGQQILPHNRYWVSELIYVLLSATAKLVLGCLFVINVYQSA